MFILCSFCRFLSISYSSVQDLLCLLLGRSQNRVSHVIFTCILVGSCCHCSLSLGLMLSSIICLSFDPAGNSSSLFLCTPHLTSATLISTCLSYSLSAPTLSEFKWFWRKEHTWPFQDQLSDVVVLWWSDLSPQSSPSFSIFRIDAYVICFRIRSVLFESFEVQLCVPRFDSSIYPIIPAWPTTTPKISHNFHLILLTHLSISLSSRLLLSATHA